MTSMPRIPEPTHDHDLWFKHGKKRYKIRLKIFSTAEKLNQYYKATVYKRFVPKKGIWAACIFTAKFNKREGYLGEMIFYRNRMNPSLIAHESNHMLMHFFRLTSGLRLSRATREEDYCETHELIMNAIFLSMRKDRIKPVLLPHLR